MYEWWSTVEVPMRFLPEVARGLDHEVPYKVLKGRVGERTRDLIRQICEARDVTIVRGAVSPDHVHIGGGCFGGVSQMPQSVAALILIAEETCV